MNKMIAFSLINGCFSRTKLSFIPEVSFHLSQFNNRALSCIKESAFSILGGEIIEQQLQKKNGYLC